MLGKKPENNRYAEGDKIDEKTTEETSNQPPLQDFDDEIHSKIQVYVRDGQLCAVSQYDGERLEDAKQGQAYNLQQQVKGQTLTIVCIGLYSEILAKLLDAGLQKNICIAN